MGWAVGRNAEGRWVGYGVPAVCDSPGCNAPIDGGDHGCGRFFCHEHARHLRGWVSVCTRCANYRTPYPPKPDTAEWLRHILAEPSWAQWRRECRDEYEAALAALFLGETTQRQRTETP